MLKINDINKYFSFPAIYKIINNINNKVYIGQSKNLYVRFLDYRKGRFNPHLKNAIEKYGIENFTVELLEKDVELCNLDNMEQYWIDFYDSSNSKNGYNICPVAGTTRGTTKSISERTNMSNRAKERVGDKNPFYGKHHTEDSKQKISDKNSKRILSKEHIEKFCKSGYASVQIKIIQKSIDGNFIKVWNSIREAAKELNICDSSISNVIHNKRKSAGSFKWEVY